MDTWVQGYFQEDFQISEGIFINSFQQITITT